MDTKDERAAHIVYFDGACPVCRREIAFHQTRMAGADIEWTDVSPDAAPADDLSRDDALRRFHIRRHDGTLVSGAAAFLALWRNDRRLRAIANILDRQPILWLLDRAYGAFLLIRRIWRPSPQARG